MPPFSEVSEKKQQRARTLFKSVPEAQRAKAWSEKPARKALEPQSRNGLEPKRYSPVELISPGNGSQWHSLGFAGRPVRITELQAVGHQGNAGTWQAGC